VVAHYDDDLRFAHVLADNADDITTRRFKALDLRVETKPDLTPVSDADRAAEESLRNVLRRSRPRDAVLGEEFGRSGAGPRCWVIDPIDGTKNYVRGVPVWATLIGLMDGPDVVVAFADLAQEAGDRTASLPAPLLLDSYEGIGPAHQAGPGAETGEEVFLGAEHRVVSRLGYGSQQVSLVVEVVVQLAARSGGAGSDLVQARPQRPLLGDDLGGGGHDALPGPASPLGSWLVSHVLQYHGYWT